MVANPANGKLNRGNYFSPVMSPFAPKNLVSGSAVPSRVSPLNLVLTHGTPPAFYDGVNTYRQPPSG